MFMPIQEVRAYFGKFLVKEKNIHLEPTLKYIHHWGFDKMARDNKAYYPVNSKHKLGVLDS